jgi:CubicO group peptidase (beta-lactamase class C family)
MLNQTSDWSGTLWAKPDWADRPEGDKAGWPNRKLNAPGTHWRYNDVRVNRLALSLMRIWSRPLPQVLREYIMDPIGASFTWEWHGYENSWVKIDGVQMQSVSGGGHWGGGLWITTWDHARFGYLCLRNGKWQDRQVLSEEWIRMARTPTGNRHCENIPINAHSMPAECQVAYGYMNWRLNTGKRMLPSCPESSFFHSGNGANIVWMDPEHDLVVVVRWIKREKLDQFLKLVLAAVESA